MAAWFNKKAAREMAKMAESLKAESLARAQAEEKLKAEIENKAAIERKVKAEAEKMLLTQFNRYNVLVERAEAKAKEAMATARAQVKEAEEKVLSYRAALAQAEEQLNEAKEQLEAEALARAEAQESLKHEREERKRIEAQLEDAIAAGKAKSEEEVQPDAVPMGEAQQKPIKAEGQVKTKTEAKTKKPPPTEKKESLRYIEQPVEVVNTFGRIRRNIFHPVNIKRKIVLLLVLVIFSAITFALSVGGGLSPAEPGNSVITEKAPPPVNSTESNSDKELLNSEVSADSSLGSLDGPATDTADAPPLNDESPDDITFKVDEEKSVPVSDTQLTIMTNPEPLTITASARGKSNIVQFSDDKRLETMAGSYIYYEFSDVSLPANAAIKSAVLFVEHFEEGRFAEGKLEWSIGTGWPGRPVVWAAMKAPVHEGESSESVDAWDITSVVDTFEEINSLQLQIKNNNSAANGKTLVDYVYVVVEYN
jgi:hypothetical protein